MTKIFFTLIFATVSSVVMAQSYAGNIPSTGSNTEVTSSFLPLQAEGRVPCDCPVSRPAPPVMKRVVPRAPVQPVEKAGVLPFGATLEQAVYLLAAMVVLMGLMIAFMVGRMTAPMQAQPQVMAPIVYVQPPPAPAPAPQPQIVHP